MTDWPSITLIVLNYNTSHIVPDCLNSLQALDYPDYKIVLVDNASTDNSVEILSQQFPNITLIANQENRGFAYGNNSALKQCDSDIAILVNPDVIVPPNWLKTFVTPFLHDATIGIAGCKLLYPDSNIIQHAGGFIRMPQALPGHYGLREADSGQYNTLRDVDYVIGAAFAIRREVIEQIGLMDEDFFLYFEETDYCFRAKDAGFRVVYVPEATAVHHESISVKRETTAYIRQMHNSRWRFLLKHVNINTILTETIPAEQEWLAQHPPFHRHAIAQSYRHTKQTLTTYPTNILTTYPTSKLTNQQTNHLSTQLTNLITLAHQTNQWDKRQTLATISDAPLASPLPLVGALRNAWNGVETRPFTQPILQQLNDWNQAVIQHMEQHQHALTNHETNIEQLSQDIQTIRAQVVEIKQLLDQLEAQ